MKGGWSWKFHPGVFDHSTDLHERLLKQGKRIVNAAGRIVIVYGEESELFDVDSAEYVHEYRGGHIPMIGIPGSLLMAVPLQTSVVPPSTAMI